MTTGEAIRQIRQAHKESWQQFAVRVGVPIEEVASWERGQKPPDAVRAVLFELAIDRALPDAISAIGNYPPDEPGQPGEEDRVESLLELQVNLLADTCSLLTEIRDLLAAPR